MGVKADPSGDVRIIAFGPEVIHGVTLGVLPTNLMVAKS
jgi:hypothetical protein